MNEGDVVEILLVEDNPADVELTLRALKKHKLANKVQVASDGIQALEILVREPKKGEAFHHPKVVFLDLKLPKVDGHEVLRRIRDDPRTKSIPVVVLTSSREESDILRTYDNGANSYVVKPLDFEKFSETVVQLGLYWVLLNEAPR